MIILNEHQILQKIKRIAIEILERNYTEEEIVLVGVNTNGYHLAEMLGNEIKKVSQVNTILTSIRVKINSNSDYDTNLKMSKEMLENKVAIIVDDVANTGRTTFLAMRPLMDIMLKKVEIAVLVNREHKLFPIVPNYVGLSLATTLQENIQVTIQENEPIKARLID